MKRDLAALQAQVFDVLVIGGGAMGAAIARDAAMRGLSVALVEAKDFASATSGASSKLIHGGLRYLQNYEFGLVREALAERRIWKDIAAHLVVPLPFLVPLFNLSLFARLKLRAGLILYDFMAFMGKGKLPRHRWIKREKAMAMAPLLHDEGLSGGIVYYDCAMDSPERLCLAMLKSAAANGAKLANYCRQEKLLLADGRVIGAQIQDVHGGTNFEIRANMTINATGPWADLVMSDAFAGNPPTRLMRSKGIHLVTRKYQREFLALALAANGRHFFLLPWRDDLTIIGTTDVKFSGDPAKVAVTEEDIAALIETTNAALPKAKLERSDVIYAYAGLRPLVDDAPAGAATSSYKASRRAEVCDHSEDGLLGFVSAVGGKWTTSRRTAERVVDLICDRLNKGKLDCQTAQTVLPGGHETWAKVAKSLAATDTGMPDDALQWIARAYGSEANEVLATIADAAEDTPLIDAHIVAATRFSVREEMALELEDVICRRTVLGVAGDPGAAVISLVAKVMSEELGWNKEFATAQIASVYQRLSIE